MKKKKEFVIDKVSEDSFYENLLLGLTGIHRGCPFVSDVHLERLPPASPTDVRFWEYANGVFLPEDLAEFYLSTNGFSLTYKFSPGEEGDEVFVGGIGVNSLQKLRQIAEYDVGPQAGVGLRLLAPNARIFAVTRVDAAVEVVMVYFNAFSAPAFWLYWRSRNFYFLCDDFSTYLRMALAHLGIPGWQLAVLRGEMPEWSAEIFRLAAPGILSEGRPPPPSQGPTNAVDPEIFRASGSCTSLPDGGDEERPRPVDCVSERAKKRHAKAPKSKKIS